jgi:pescadillo protein
VFVSIKGIYYQVEILGQKVLYLVPWKFPSELPIEVDYRVMGTFLEFYLTMVKFVNYKLYAMGKLEYPPEGGESGSCYGGYKMNVLPNKETEIDQKYQIDQQFANTHTFTSNNNFLFSNLHFYLSTEVPRQSLEYVILAFGGTITY